MAKKVFLSYCHEQGPWVWGRLLPVLKAAGCEVFIDIEQFKGGYDVVGQMDEYQDQADVSLLVLSPDYLASKNCQHEMKRAIKGDPDFSKGKVLPVVLVSCDMSAFKNRRRKPVWRDLTDDCDAAKWNSILRKSLDAYDLRAEAPHWLRARDEIVRKMRDHGESVNLLVQGNPNWRALVHHVKNEYIQDLAMVDLSNPATITRAGLVRQILVACGGKTDVPARPRDLEALNSLLERPGVVRLALLNFEIVHDRIKEYGVELFHTLRHLRDSRRVVLLIESNVGIRDLVPTGHQLSNPQMDTVELREA